MWEWLIIMTFFFGVFCIGSFHAVREANEQRRLAADWHLVTEGDYASVEYGYYDHHYRTSSGRGGRRTSHHVRRMDETVVRFVDGRVYPLEGRHDIPFTVGTPVRIWENGLGHRRIEPKES